MTKKVPRPEAPSYARHLLRQAAPSAFHSSHRAHKLLRVKSPQSNPTPNWKHVILATHEWPDDLVVPQNDALPEDSEAIQDSMSTKENWEWELWRNPDGHSYYLKLWPMDEGDFGNPKTPGVELSVMETFQFLFTNWMPREVTADLICDHPDMVKHLGYPVTKPGLN